MRDSVLVGSLALLMVGVGARAGQDAIAQQVAQQAIPDAPKPQVNLPTKSVAPGQGTTSTSESDANSSPAESEPTGPAAGTPAAATPAAGAPATAPATPAGGVVVAGSDSKGPPPSILNNPDVPVGQGLEALQTIHTYVNEVDLPFTVKDSKGRLMPGIQSRDVRVYENGLLQHISLFTDDALPLSVALVIDQSMAPEDMQKVNNALGALQDAFTSYDEVAVFTYNKSTKQITDFTGAQSPRAAQAIEQSKGSGRDALMAGSLSGPLAQTTVINDQQFDPNTVAQRGHTGMQLDVPREFHPLNDAILRAAIALSNRPRERRRVIYVISNGNEYGSEAKTSEVIKVLNTNNIEVDGTLVGNNAMWGLGTLDRMHLPLFMQDNLLVAYRDATGGQIDSEWRTGAIEKSFARVAAEARYRYTLAYVTHEPFLDGKYRRTVVVVDNHGNDLTVLAKKGYWPAAMELRPRPAAVPAQ